MLRKSRWGAILKKIFKCNWLKGNAFTPVPHFDAQSIACAWRKHTDAAVGDGGPLTHRGVERVARVVRVGGAAARVPGVAFKRGLLAHLRLWRGRVGVAGGRRCATVAVGGDRCERVQIGSVRVCIAQDRTGSKTAGAVRVPMHLSCTEDQEPVVFVDAKHL